VIQERDIYTKTKCAANRNDWLVAAAKCCHAIEDLPDTIIEAVRAANMDERHNHLNKLMDST